MTGFIGDDQIAAIKARVDLVVLVSEYSPMKIQGSGAVGCCPFHQERTPSFHVYPDKGNYHCFGCGANGDALALLQAKERLSFPEAVELLAKKVGFQITYTGGPGQAVRAEKRTTMLDAMEQATSFYEQALWTSAAGEEAVLYLENRGLSIECIKRFRLGWAPGGGALVSSLQVSDEILLAADLAVNYDGRIIDRFFKRITFPICDRSGHPVAFSARILPGGESAKYVNSRSTVLYEKSRTVWNIHRARFAAKSANRVVIMEGPTDVMSADQAGISECVAPMGTALTIDHVRQIGNILGETGNLYVCLDGDRAGIEAARKAVATIWSAGFQAKIIVLPDRQDPAEFFLSLSSPCSGSPSPNEDKFK